MSDGPKQPRKLKSGRDIPLSQLDGRTVIELESSKQTGAFLERLFAHFRKVDSATIVDTTNPSLGSKPEYLIDLPGTYLILNARQPKAQDRLKEEVYRITLSRLNPGSSMPNSKPLVDMLPIGRRVQLFLSGERQPEIEAIVKQVKADFPNRNEYSDSKIFFLRGEHQAHAFLGGLTSHYKNADGTSKLTVAADSDTLPGNNVWSVSLDAGDKKDPLLLQIDTASGHMRIRANGEHPEYPVVQKLHNLAKLKPVRSPQAPSPLPELFSNALENMGPHEIRFSSGEEKHTAKAELESMRVTQRNINQAAEIILEHKDWERLETFDAQTLRSAMSRISEDLECLEENKANLISTDFQTYMQMRIKELPKAVPTVKELVAKAREFASEDDLLREETTSRLTSQLLRLQIAQAATPTEERAGQINYLTTYIQSRTVPQPIPFESKGR